jgi:choline dehydrogenase
LNKRGPVSPILAVLTGPGSLDPADIESNLLSHPDDLKAPVAVVELCREICNSVALHPFLKQEVVPGNVKESALENYLRNTAVSWWHQTCTAKMGRDSLSVVDANLKVYGIENLRIADGSIMPRVTGQYDGSLRGHWRTRCTGHTGRL